jgi:hypothetical protein
MNTGAFMGTNFRPLCNDGPLSVYREPVVREPAVQYPSHIAKLRGCFCANKVLSTETIKILAL